MQTNTNSKTFSTNGKTPSANGTTTPNQTPSVSPSDPVAEVQGQANLAIEALHQAGLANAAQAISRHVQRLELNSNELAATMTTLLDPDLVVALAELKAARAVNDRLGKQQELPVGGFQKVSIDIPGIPSFGRFYAAVSPAAPQLTHGDSSNSSIDTPAQPQ